MKSIFLHFSIPGSIYLNQYHDLMNSYESMSSLCVHLTWAKCYFIELASHPLSFIAVFGFPIIFTLFIVGVTHLFRVDIIQTTPKILFFRVISAHFEEVHPNMNSVKSNQGNSLIYKYPVSNVLVVLFLSLALINLGGMVHGTWCITTWFSATIGLSLAIWLLTWFFRMYNYLTLFFSNITLYEGEELIGLAGFFPSGTPLWLAPLMVIIEILSWVIRFLSMGLRIAGNIVAGHVILGILGFAYLELYKLMKIQLELSSVTTSIIMQASYTILTYFELAVALIQAYVLTLLASTFLKETEEVH